VFPFTIAGGEINTWASRSFVIPGDTSGTWLTDAGIGINIGVTLSSGTTFNGTAGSWAGSDVRSVSGATSFMATGSATFDVADVGLYVDPLAIGAAPAWELPAWDADLRACQRYYTVLINQIVFDGYVLAAATTVNNIAFPTTMRAATPVAAYSNVSYSNGSGISTNAISSTTLRVGVVATATGAAFVTYDAAINARF
jgi:hypothetical protein